MCCIGPSLAAEGGAVGLLPVTKFKDAWLAEVRKGKMVFYSTVVAQAQRIDVTGTGAQVLEVQVVMG